MGIVNNMKLATATILSAFAAGASAFAPVTTGSVKSTSLASTKGGLETLAKDLNPVVGYFDPLSLAEADFWGQGEASAMLRSSTAVLPWLPLLVTVCRAISTSPGS